MNHPARALWIFGFLVPWLDGMTTWYALKYVSVADEGNLFLAGLMAQYGVVPVLIVRVLVGVLVVAFLAFLSEDSRVFPLLRATAPYLLMFATLGTALVVGNNFSVILYG